MKVNFTVIFEDDASCQVEFEKPPGYHPENKYVGQLAAEIASKQHNKVAVKAQRVNAATRKLPDGSPAPIFIGITIWEGRCSP